MLRRTEKATEEAYFEAVDYVHHELDARDIDFRVVGSLASHALIRSAGGEPSPLRFQRPYAIEASQALPDIDIIVPRENYGDLKQMREELAEAEISVSLGLAASRTEIDFRPGEDASYLTHGETQFRVSNEVMQPQYLPVGTTWVRTLSLDTHLHTYGTFGGLIRRKDLATVKALDSFSGKIPHSDLQPFHDFSKHRKANITPTERRVRLANHLAERSPALLGNAIKVLGKNIANRKGLR